MLGTVDYDPDVKSVDLDIAPDQNVNGIPELAVLSEDPAQVEVRDALTGNLVNTVTYVNNMMPKDLLVLPDLNGKGGPETGVLGENNDPDEADRVQIRDLLTGSWVRNLPFQRLNVSKGQNVPDLNNNGTPEVAVLRTGNGKVNVLIMDAVTNTLVQGFRYDPNYSPGELLVLLDINGNGASEIAVFGKNPNNGTQKAQVRDGKTKEWIRNVFYDKTVIPGDIVVIPDINGNGAPEIGLLGTRENGSILRLIIKDSKTGKFVGTVFF